VRASRGGPQRAWCRRNARSRSRWLTRNRFAPTDIDGVNAPAFAGATVIAGHSPAEPADSETERQVDDCCGKALRIATPSLATCNRTAPISGGNTVVPAHDEAASNGKNVLKCISTASAHLQHASIEPNIWIHVRRFEIEILLEDQLH
jgi:hypothetical protein